jgi:hypothetical protein
MINQRAMSIAVLVATTMIGAVQVAGPESLGISTVAIRWLGIVAAGLAIWQSVLPRVQGPTTDPEALADRIDGMPADDREALRAILDLRHGVPDGRDPLPPNPRYPFVPPSDPASTVRG